MDGHSFFGPAHYENAKDSVEFTQFRTGMRSVDPTGTTNTTIARYRMLWQEDQHGGSWSVGRGDSTLLQPSTTAALALRFGLPFRTADGKSGVVVVHETPCGLVCRSAYYYVED